MSKLANIRAYQRSPQYAGDFFSKIIKAGKGLFAKGKKLAQKLPGLVEQGVTGVTQLVEEAGGGGGGTGTGKRRRSRGITARELRGFRKVSRLLHSEGMVSRRARGRK